MFTQTKTIDSLLTLIKSQKNDTNKVNSLNRLGKKYGMSGDVENTIKYAGQAKELGEKLNYNKGVGHACRTLGILYFDNAEYDKAFATYFKALKNYEIINDKSSISATYNNIGLVYLVAQANYPKALDYYLKALKIKEQINDEKSFYRSYMNIGEVYHYQNNYTLALRYYFSALRLAKKYKNEVQISDCYMNIGVAYENQGNLTQALEYDLKALASKEKLNETLKIAQCLGNVGNIYYYKKDLKNALEFQLKSLKLKESANDKVSISDCMTNIGEIYIKLKEYTKSLNYYTTALKIKQEIGDKNGLRVCYLGLAEVNAKMNHYKEAYTYQIKFKKLNDTIFNLENSKQLGDLKTNFEVEKKSTELKIKSEVDKEKMRVITKEEKRIQQIITSAVVGVLIIVLVFSFFLFKRFKLTNKQKAIIEIKNAETEVQKYLVEEKQKEIISSITYAKRLQNAILPPQDFINNYLPNNFLYYQPKDIIAGDFYWMHISTSSLVKNGEEFIFIAAADSTGHGVPGAMVSIVCSNALEKAVKEFGLTDTGKILDKTTDLVLETFAKSGEEIKDGMDISLLAIDKKNKKIYWSGANNSLWFITPLSSGVVGEPQNEANKDEPSLKEIKPDKQPIGKNDNRKPFTTHEINYQPGTIFYLMTDGYADQFGGPLGKKYKYKQLEGKLSSIYSKALNEQKEILSNDFLNWRGQLEQVDDVTIIGIKI